MSTRRLHPFTARFDPELFEEVQTVSEMQGNSINQFVMTAVRSHLREARCTLTEQYESALGTLRRYAREDPDFDQAIEAFAHAEAEHADPLEGRISRRTPLESSAAERRLDELLTRG